MTTCWSCEPSAWTCGSAASRAHSTSTFISFSLWETSERVVPTIAFRSASARWGVLRREKARRSETMRPVAGRLGDDLVEVLPELGLPPLRDAVVLQDPLHEHREVEDAGERVVDLVRDARRELAERGEPVGLHQLLLRDLQLLGPLLHLLLEAAGEAVDLVHRLRRGARRISLNERASSASSSLDVEGDRPVELHLGHVPRRVREAREGLRRRAGA